MSINITENLGGEVKFFETLHGSIRSEELYCVFNDSNYLYANLDGYVDESYRRMNRYLMIRRFGKERHGARINVVKYAYNNTTTTSKAVCDNILKSGLGRRSRVSLVSRPKQSSVLKIGKRVLSSKNNQKAYNNSFLKSDKSKAIKTNITLKSKKRNRLYSQKLLKVAIDKQTLRDSIFLKSDKSKAIKTNTTLKSKKRNRLYSQKLLKAAIDKQTLRDSIFLKSDKSKSVALNKKANVIDNCTISKPSLSFYQNIKLNEKQRCIFRSCTGKKIEVSDKHTNKSDATLSSNNSITLACAEKTKNESFTELNNNTIRNCQATQKNVCREHVGLSIINNEWEYPVISHGYYLTITQVYQSVKNKNTLTLE